ncbi:Acyl-CoA dehydrogenase [Sinosporangium album]|uniref:Acyl-CoA dehydrogenase n=1 Tax=Sinosporangium album TaxID=504805 RepID=A0A1G8A7V0_9ACTN|nr:acyl-CoA dehydrogenase [Sinosporangium album]SDH17022.1 Acyl-CoA dehydrogenase [Sinosporangium album]
MIELDRRLTLLRGQAHEWAAQMRPHALEVDRDPEAVIRIVDLPALSRVGTLQIPPEFNPDPLVVGGEKFYLMSALERVVFFEEGAWGDLGIMLAAPGAPMTGIAVDTLGSPRQRELFFGRILERPTWTFFALTEPEVGSDAARMRTRLEGSADGATARLNGAKRYVGNAVRAQMGVVFARTGPGMFGLGAALVETDTPGFTAVAVDTIGVRGAQLGAIGLAGVEVDRDRILGSHLSPTRRGMWGWLKTFNLLRPAVATMGVGVARAAFEYVREHRGAMSADERWRLDRIGRRIEAVRQLVRAAAIAVDHDPSDGHLASAAKVSAARLAEQVTLEALGFFGPGARLDHPLLEKLARDARAVEYMEGTRNIQRLSVFAGVVKGRFDPGRSAGR